MQKKVVVVNYGMGNLRSVAQALKHAGQGLNYLVEISSDTQVLQQADHIVLPGQGSISTCMQELKKSGLLHTLLEVVQYKPLFGVCVGMQLLLSYSQEGNINGLNLIPGDVLRLQVTNKKQANGNPYKIPQMGWNQVKKLQPHPLWEGIPDQSWFYFVHSYYASPLFPKNCVGQTDYAEPICVAIAKDNLFATQFHPEKSGTQGLKLYRNFLQWNP